MSTKRIFIAATKQNDGKTTISLGLICNFKDKFKQVAFIKPIGQRYLEEEGLKIDEDSLLIEEVCGTSCGLKDMSPIAVERGFTEKYISRPHKDTITRQIKNAFHRVCEGQDLVVIEGTGHAGVGSVFDHSNAVVAKLLNSGVIIVSSGGVGRPIDEIVLNKALFEKHGVKVLGAIINKVLPEKYERISRLVRKGIKRKGIETLGVIPYRPFLSYPTIRQILEETSFRLLCGLDYLENSVARVIVCAMEPHDAIKYIVEDTLLITPGDREDIIMTALWCRWKKDSKRLLVSGMVLTGGIMPAKSIMNLLADSRIPVLLSRDDTYSVVAHIHDLTVKLRSIDTVIQLIRDHVDLEKIARSISHGCHKKNTR